MIGERIEVTPKIGLDPTMGLLFLITIFLALPDLTTKVNSYDDLKNTHFLLNLLRILLTGEQKLWLWAYAPIRITKTFATTIKTFQVIMHIILVSKVSKSNKIRSSYENIVVCFFWRRVW